MPHSSSWRTTSRSSASLRPSIFRIDASGDWQTQLRVAALGTGFPDWKKAVVLSKSSTSARIGFSDGSTWRIPFELMRVYSPSAEVQGHGPGQEVLQTGKRDVDIVSLEPVGNYGVKLAYRRSVMRDWLVMESRVSLTFPKEEPWQAREATIGVGIGFEMLFGTDEFLARPVTF